METDMIKITHLKKSFGDVKAVNDLSFQVKKGELFAFLGVNGAGKSTTISIICGQLRKDSGTVQIQGTDLDKIGRKVGTMLGVVFQDSVLDKPLTVRENLKNRAALYGITGKAFEKRLRELVEIFDFGDYLNRPVGKLSGGQRRRIDIARALLHRPELLILDEPTTGLDPQTRLLIWDIIEKLRVEEKLTVFLTTHYMEEAANAGYVVILDKGSIVAEGTPFELKNEYVQDTMSVYGVTEEEIKKGLRVGTIANKIVPVTCGSSYKNRGVQELLDAIVDYMPSPLDIAHIKGKTPDGEETEAKTSDTEPFAALAFKIATDPFVGKLCFFRVYSGTLESGSTVLNSSKDKKERIGRILQMHSNHREDIDKVYAGDIAAAVGLKEVTTGNTLCDPNHPIILESMEFPEPVIDIAIEPKDKAAQEKMGIALTKLAEEDPTFKAYTNQETGQTIIAGMGELHLDIIVDRLKREFKVECNVGKPQVAYKETIRNKVKVQGKFIRQSGGKGQYGDVWFEMEPLEPGKGIEFESKIVGGAVPKEYIKPIEQGMREAAESGILAGYPVIDFKVSLVDGSYHEVDSSEMAFKIAASMAFKEGCKQAKSVILEPIMKVEITVPEEYMGDVIGDVNSRRGRMEGMDAEDGMQEIHAFIPLSEMFGYATDLRSKTQGRGSYSMEPSHYEEVPKSVLETIVASRKKAE